MVDFVESAGGTHMSVTLLSSSSLSSFFHLSTETGDKSYGGEHG